MASNNNNFNNANDTSTSSTVDNNNASALSSTAPVLTAAMKTTPQPTRVAALTRSTTFELSPTYAELSKEGVVANKRAIADAPHLWPDLQMESDDSLEDNVTLDQAESATVVRQTLNDYFHEVGNYSYKVREKSHIWDHGHMLTVDMIIKVCESAATLLKREKTLVEISSPCYVLGDIHGNYRDLMFFRSCLWPLGPAIQPASFLFLGDYVDRGPHSVETAAYLLSLKVAAPHSIFLLQGNHEQPSINGDIDTYGINSFKSQCQRLYGDDDGERVWNAFNEAFSVMPLSAVIDKRVFCTHGGVPRLTHDAPAGTILNTIAQLQRPLGDDLCQLATDLLWSDPALPEEVLGCEGFPPGFGPSDRGDDVCVFGETAAMNFFAKTGCTHMIRAHQPPTIGAHFTRNARVITVFSSSHYCGGYNAAAVILIDKRRLQVIVTQISTKVEDGAGEIVQSVASTHNSDDEDSSSSSSSSSSEGIMAIDDDSTLFTDASDTYAASWAAANTQNDLQSSALDDNIEKPRRKAPSPPLPLPLTDASNANTFDTAPLMNLKSSSDTADAVNDSDDDKKDLGHLRKKQRKNTNLPPPPPPLTHHAMLPPALPPAPRIQTLSSYKADGFNMLENAFEHRERSMSRARNAAMQSFQNANSSLTSESSTSESATMSGDLTRHDAAKLLKKWKIRMPRAVQSMIEENPAFDADNDDDSDSDDNDEEDENETPDMTQFAAWVFDEPSKPLETSEKLSEINETAPKLQPTSSNSAQQSSATVPPVKRSISFPDSEPNTNDENRKRFFNRAQSMSAFTNTPPPSAPPTEHCSLDDIAKFIDETESYARRADWQLRRAFAFADKNGNGKVERSELSAALRMLAEENNSSTQLVALADDVGKVGVSNQTELDFDQFRRLVQRLEDITRSQNFVRLLFQQLDVGNKRHLSSNDLKQLSVAATRALMRRCLPISNAIAASNRIIDVLRKTADDEGKVTPSQFAKAFELELRRGQRRDAFVWRHFRQAGPQEIDVDQLFALLDALDAYDHRVTNAAPKRKREQSQ